MSFRTIIVGFLALICGISATIGVNQLRAPRATASGASNVEVVSIVVAKLEIESGEKLTAENLTTIDWPKNLRPEGAFMELKDPIGQYALGSIKPNEPITSQRVSENPTVLRIPPGMRAVTISTPKESAIVAGHIQPGNRVDVILTINSSRRTSDLPRTLTLMENIEVGAVGTDTSPVKDSIDAKRNIKSATLFVDFEQAEDINLAASLGNLSLSLRNPDDTDVRASGEIVSLTELHARLIEGPSQPEENEQIKSVQSELATLREWITGELAKPHETMKPAIREIDIPADMRAFSILTPTEANGVAGLIRPGDRVDVMFTLSPAERRLLASSLPDSYSEHASGALALLGNVQVLAVGQDFSTPVEGEEPEVTKSITLIVSPEMARDLSLAEAIGTLSLALRSRNDQSSPKDEHFVKLTDVFASAVASGRGLSDLDAQSTAFGNSSSSDAATVRMLRGNATSDVVFYYGSRPRPIDAPALTNQEGDNE